MSKHGTEKLKIMYLEKKKKDLQQSLNDSNGGSIYVMAD